MFFLLNLRKIKTVKKNYLLLISIFLFFVGFFSYDSILPHIIPNNLNIVSTKVFHHFTEPLLFGLSLSSIPLLYFLSLFFVNKKYGSLCIITITAILSFLVYYIVLDFFELPNTDKVIKYSIFYDSIQYHYFIFSGAFIGTILSIFIFKKSKPQS